MSLTYSIAHDVLVGFPNAVSGRAWFYLPNSTTLLAIFGDDSGTSISNPVTLDSNGSARVYLSQLARMLVQDASGATIADTVINKDSTSVVVNTSAAFTGPTQKEVNDSALTAFGGQNFTYVPSGAWPGMTPQAWMNGVFRNVKAYGAKGDGVTLDDSAIAAAVADVSAAGGGTVYFPPGTFLINSAIVMSSLTGVRILGAGMSATTIKGNGGAQNGFTISAATQVTFEEFNLTHSATSTGIAFALSGTSNIVTLRRVGVNGIAMNSLYSGGAFIATGTFTNIRVIDCDIAGKVSLTGTGTSQYIWLTGGRIWGGAGAVTFSGTTSQVSMSGVNAQGTVVWAGALTGQQFSLTGNQLPGAGALTISSAADPGIIGALTNQGWPAHTGAAAIGGNITMSYYPGISTYTANAGGAGAVTMNVPTIGNPSSEVSWSMRLVGASGGNAAFTFPANFHIVGGGATITVTTGHVTVVQWTYDSAAFVWREQAARADSLT